jgi:lysophospholipase L1-like esterase
MDLRFAPNQTVVCDGDSLTQRGTPRRRSWPFLRLMGWDKPWPDVMDELLFCWRPDLNLTFHNAAVGGSTCRGLLERCEQTVLPHKPGWCLVSLGGNDATHEIPPDEFGETMTRYATAVHDASGGQTLFFGLSEQGPDYPAFKRERLQQRRSYYARFAAIAEVYPFVHYVDFGPGLARKARLLQAQCELHSLYGDTGHFNALGHTVLAGEMLKAFGILRED